MALSGIIACQILDGQHDVAKEQLEFLKGMLDKIDFLLFNY